MTLDGVPVTQRDRHGVSDPAAEPRMTLTHSLPGAFAPEEDPLRAARGFASAFALSAAVWILIALVLWLVAGA